MDFVNERNCFESENFNQGIKVFRNSILVDEGLVRENGTGKVFKNVIGNIGH